MGNVITIQLTDEQLKQLEPIINRMSINHQLGEIGMSFGQLWYDDDTYGQAHFRYFEEGAARRIIEAANLPDDSYAAEWNRNYELEQRSKRDVA